MGRTIEEALERARERRAARLSPFLRHARRGGAHRWPTPRAIAPPTTHAIAAIGTAAGGRAVDEAPGHLGQALGAAPALRDGAARAGAARVAAAPARARRARRAHAGIGFTIDAEEADRLELSLDLFEALALAPGARRLGRARPRGAGLSEAGAAGDRLARRSGRGGRGGG